MSDEKAVVHIGENSPEQVAHKLTKELLYTFEKKNAADITRKEYLDTYAECLEAVHGHRPWR